MFSTAYLNRVFARLWALVLIVAHVCSGAAWAVSSPPETAVDLVYMNRVLYTMRVTIAGTSPEVRAERALERMRALEPRQRTLPIVATIVSWEGEQGVALSVEDQTLLTVFARDIDPEAGATLAQVASTTRARLQEALTARDQMSQPQVLLRGIALTGAGLLVALLFVWAVTRARRMLAGRLQALVEQQARSHRLFGIDWSEFGYRFAARLTQGLFYAALVLLAYLWVGHTVRQFPATQPLAQGMRRVTVGLLLDAGGVVWGALPKLGMCLFIVVVARSFIWLLGKLFDGVSMGRLLLPGVHAETVGATRRLAVFAVWGLALAAAYPYIPGSQSDVFRGLSVFVGFMITLGSSGVVSQWMHGLVIVYSRALRPGDFVRIGTVEGFVSELSALAVKVVDHRNDEVTLPNSTVIAGSVINYTKLARNGFAHGSVAVSIGYDVPWRQVHDLLHEAARRAVGVQADPPPQVLQRALSDFYVEYEAVCQFDLREPRAHVVSRLHAAIQDVFGEAGVQILSPHFETQIQLSPDSHSKA